MAWSMTGFGRGSIESRGKQFVVEARSVNSRYCEVRVHAGRRQLEFEYRLEALIKGMFSRGQFDVVVKIEQPGSPAVFRYQEQHIVQRWRQLEQLRKRLRIERPVPLEAALRWMSTEEHESPNKEMDPLMRAAQSALVQLRRSRQQEGKTLIKDLRQRGKKLMATMNRISLRAEKMAPTKYKKLQERVAILLNGAAIDKARLATELALMIDRYDITEELIRLQSHMRRMEQLLTESEEVGRKLDFLCQELNREVNTIGSKANDDQIALEVLVMKTELEKIREQAQNLE